MEDQHYNGDVWNHEIFKLFHLLGWQRIGDYDMDVIGEDGKKMGIDTVVSFETPLKNKPQLAILEAKRYKTTSFTKNLLQDWVTRLDAKLLKLRNSDKFYDTFPSTNNCTIADTGIIAIWFSDTDNYKNFLPKYKECLSQISISTRMRKAGLNKIYVMDNTSFMKLFSLQTEINTIKSNGDLNFTYSPRFNNEEPLFKSSTLTIEYMFSDAIFAEQQVKEDGKERTLSYIFYFGDLNYNSFEMLKAAYSKKIGWDRTKDILLYVYNADDEFRKIENDIKEKIFDTFKISIKRMTANNNIPSFIVNAE